MTAGVKDFTIEQGSAFSRVLTWKDENEAAINLTGYTARMYIKEKYSDTDSLLQLTTANSRITLGGAAGTITLSVLAADTATLEANAQVNKITGDKYVYDLELISAGGAVTRLLHGNIIVTDEVTK
jgi:hypothetical protein